MLSKFEYEIMNAVYGLCDGTEGCLVSAAEILSVLPNGKKFSAEGIDRALCNLRGDGYFDLISSSRAGQKMYVITLKESGMNFRRNQKKRLMDIGYKIALAFVGALATFVFGIILKAMSCG